MEDSTYTPVSIGNWLLTSLLMCIPLINIILLFVWAFGGNTPVSKANWAKAALIWAVISVIISVLFFLMIGVGAAVSSAAHTM